jgi:hypothetical protein
LVLPAWAAAEFEEFDPDDADELHAASVRANTAAPAAANLLRAFIVLPISL